MHSMCTGSGKPCAKLLEEKSKLSTHSTELKTLKLLNPQNTQHMHNFYTQFYTYKNSALTDRVELFSTVSTKTITTTTII